jgi:small redox-active disulfide protein 2
MTIKILGSGCAKCKKLEELTQQVVKELNIDIQVIKEGDFAKIASYGVMQTPALVIDENVVLHGRVPGFSELKELISKVM